MQVGKQLKMIRQQCGLSQYQLAESSKVPRLTISRIELSKVEPRLSTLERLARALKVDVFELLKPEGRKIQGE